MMELMQGYAKEGANLGLDDPEQWDPDVVSFLSATTSVSSADELIQVCPALFVPKQPLICVQHPFLRSWRKEKLKGLISLVVTWTRQDYEYLGWQKRE